MQPSVSDSLAQVYGNTKTASHSSEDAKKLAETQLFVGLCKSAGIDPTHLTDAQINKLWKAAADEMPPAAEKKEEKKPEEKKEEEAKKEAAVKEWALKRELQEKIAEADALGRVMAHAYAQELKKIAEFPPGFMPGGGAPPAEKKEEKKEEHESKETPAEEKKEEEKKKESQAKAEALIAEFAKKASGSTTPNLDEQAALQAIAMLKQAGVDEQLAYARVNAVFTLGLEESAKIASAKTADDAQTLRALEFCEAAKFPVDWSKV